MLAKRVNTPHVPIDRKKILKVARDVATPSRLREFSSSSPPPPALPPILASSLNGAVCHPSFVAGRRVVAQPPGLLEDHN